MLKRMKRMEREIERKEREKKKRNLIFKGMKEERILRNSY